MDKEIINLRNSLDKLCEAYREIKDSDSMYYHNFRILGIVNDIVEDVLIPWVYENRNEISCRTMVLQEIEYKILSIPVIDREYERLFGEPGDPRIIMVLEAYDKMESHLIPISSIVSMILEEKWKNS